MDNSQGGAVIGKEEILKLLIERIRNTSYGKNFSPFDQLPPMFQEELKRQKLWMERKVDQKPPENLLGHSIPRLDLAVIYDHVDKFVLAAKIGFLGSGNKYAFDYFLEDLHVTQMCSILRIPPETYLDSFNDALIRLLSETMLISLFSFIDSECLLHPENVNSVIETIQLVTHKYRTEAEGLKKTLQNTKEQLGVTRKRKKPDNENDENEDDLEEEINDSLIDSIRKSIDSTSYNRYLLSLMVSKESAEYDREMKLFSKYAIITSENTRALSERRKTIDSRINKKLTDFQKMQEDLVKELTAYQVADDLFQNHATTKSSVELLDTSNAIRLQMHRLNHKRLLAESSKKLREESQQAHERFIQERQIDYLEVRKKLIEDVSNPKPKPTPKSEPMQVDPQKNK